MSKNAVIIRLPNDFKFGWYVCCEYLIVSISP